MSYALSTRKRILDLAVAVPLFLLSLPIQAVLALAVLSTLGPPVFFRQRRPGLDGRLFTLVKFRSMIDAPHPVEDRQLDDGERLTRLGRFLRRTSLDELPELVAVVKGDLSLVGPRPLLPQYLDRYSPRQARRHEVRPGLTGWAQINGRNASSWENRLENDVWYVDHATLGLDLRILWRTLFLMLSGRGVAAPGHATAPEFDGGATRDRPREER